MSMSRPREHARSLNPERQFLLQHIGFDKAIVRGEGHYLFDEAGVAYFDALSQYGALPFGHNPPQIWDEILRVHRNGEPSFVQPLASLGAEELGQRLLAIAPPNFRYVTYVNSGAEASEVAIKLARARTQRPTILSLKRGFHGKTLGALSSTGNARYRAPFLLDTNHFEILPFGEIDVLADRLKRGDVAALMIEAIQGEGGMRVQPDGYMRAASELCKAHGTLLVLDEVQSGLGRTGGMFAFTHEDGVEPDVILLAKALGGGLFPLGAVLCTQAAWSQAFGMYHSSTFANSHLTCTVGCAVIDTLLANDGAIIRNARAMGALLRDGLDALVAKYPRALAAATGRGLMQGLALRDWSNPNSYFTAHASHLGFSVPIVAGHLLNEHRIITAPVFNQSNVLRIQPALTCTADEIERLLAGLDATIRLIEDENFVGLFAYMVGAKARPRAVPMPVAEKRSAALRCGSAGKRRGGYVFLIHPTDERILFDTFPPEFGQLEMGERQAWDAWMRSWFSKMYEPAPVLHLPALRSREGGYVEGWLIACPLTPSQMLRLNADKRVVLLHQYLEAARKLDVDIVGMGAFTSIISAGGTSIAGSGLNLTTGNSLTAISSAESMLELCRRRGVDLDRERVAIIGAAGSVGRLAALHCARFARRIVLVGNMRNQRAMDGLEHVAGEICAHAMDLAAEGHRAGIAAVLARCDLAALKGLREECREGGDAYPLLYREVRQFLEPVCSGDPPLILTTDIGAALPKATAILSATSAGRAFIDLEAFRPGSIVCDVARPMDILHTIGTSRRDMLVYEGGVMHLPEDISFGRQNVLGYPSGLNVACLSETITLAMEGATRSYSLGNRIDYHEAVHIYQAAIRHGFRPHFPESHATVVDAFPSEAALDHAALMRDEDLRPRRAGELNQKAAL